jgi:GT2 family glycosyltransferase
VLVPSPAGEARAAVAAQTRSPQELVAGADLRAALEAGLERGARWLWLLDDSALPEPPALEALLDALGRLGPLPPPSLLASRVITAAGGLDRGSLPVPEVRDPDDTLAAFKQRLLAVRLVRGGSLLLKREALERHRLPRPGCRRVRDDLAWSARLLRHEPGLLVPDSVATARAGGEDDREEVRRLRRLLLSDGLAGREKLFFAVRLVEALFGSTPADGPDRRAGRAGSPARSRGAGS